MIHKMALMKITKSNVLLIFMAATIIVFAGGVIAQNFVSSVSDVNFDVNFKNHTCIVVSDSNSALFPDYELGVSYWRAADTAAVNSWNNCFRADGIDRNGLPRDTCCPISSSSCNLETNNCEFDGQQNGPMGTCDDYSASNGGSEEDCEADSYHPEKAAFELNSVLEGAVPPYLKGCDYYNADYSKLCYEYIDCKCKWDDDTEKCMAESNHIVEKINPDSKEWWDWDNLPDNINTICGPGSSINSGRCAFQFTVEGDCSAGDDFLTRSWTAVFNGPESSGGIKAIEYCKPGSEVIPCDRVVRLPFFSLQNIIIAIILLVIIYYFILKKKKK
jgi:hypothetical protein